MDRVLEILFIMIFNAYVSMRCTVIIDYLLYFYPLHYTQNDAVNR